MSRKRRSSSQGRRLQFERFEKRLVMSGQSIAPDIVEMLPELEVAAPAITQQDVAIQTNDGVAGRGLENIAAIANGIAAEYGFDGTGQTIAVIDTGIAFDHAAFGDGFGEGERVVGGFDFAENDANPFDDGPAGFHGTHVAGIIGSEDPSQLGVASGADLVALRVFDDNGVGDFELVERALQYVIDNKDSFRFPITTVNLSLGTRNAPTDAQGLGILEDEFAQLNDAGIFISVAAGNGFQQLGQQGVSYPAASPFVVPVASHGADGQLSDFSQRDDRVLVAPGELVRSAVPDHLFGGRRQDAFLTSSGTSQAAPYLAGASSILRQANEFVGNFGVTQQQLYQQFVDTSDQVFDAITGQFYNRVNFRSALESVIQDRYGDQVENATSVGQLNDGESIEGTIGKLADVDAIEFVAESTGRLELTISGTHQLDATINFGDQAVEIDGNRVFVDVVAGEAYRFSIQTEAGTGHYDIQASYQAVPSAPEAAPVAAPIELGTVVADQFAGQTVNGQQAYHLTAARDGVLTVEANVSTSQPLRLEAFNQAGQSIGVVTGSSNLRIDTNVLAGERITLVASNEGGPQAFDLSVANLVSLDSGTLTLNGTDQNDTITIDTQDGFSANINGWQYNWALESVDNVVVEGHQGDDSIDVTLGSSNDRVNLLPELVQIRNQDFQFQATGFASATVDGGGGGFDSLFFIDSDQSEQITAGINDDGQSRVSLSQSGQTVREAVGFERNYVRSSSGNDRLVATGSEGADRLTAFESRSFLSLSNRSRFILDGFSELQFNGNGGRDIATLRESSGDDAFTLTPDSSRVDYETTSVQIDGFYRVNAITAGNGRDTLSLVDSRGNDTLTQNNQSTTLDGDGYQLVARGFTSIRARSVGGLDTAVFHDTENNDRFSYSPGSTRLTSVNLSVRATGFEQTSFISTAGGSDRATISASAGDDQLSATASDLSLRTSGGQTLQLTGVDRTFVNLGDGNDQVDLNGSSDRERLDVGPSIAKFDSAVQSLRVRNFQQIEFDGNGGGDTVELDGPVDLLAAIGDEAQVVFDRHRVRLREFSVLDIRSLDQAITDFDIDTDGLNFEIQYDRR